MTRFMARIVIPIDADTPEEAQEILLEYIRNGIKTNCAVELSHAPDEEEAEHEEQVSFQELLNNLNSADMTKN